MTNATDTISPTSVTLRAIREADQDFEWYPTTQRMIDAVAKRITDRNVSLLDIGAGDGRVLLSLGKHCQAESLYAIEKSPILVQSQPDNVVPVGTDLFEQNLACLPVDYIFCNPPYSQYETWVTAIVESGYAKQAYLVIPRRWQDSVVIKASLEKRGATARVIHSDDFRDADRAARAVVDIVEVSYPRNEDDYCHKVKDPFDIWFDQNIDTFDEEGDDIPEYQRDEKELAKIRHLTDIADMVAGFNEEYARMEDNYRAIFKLDHALIKELGVSKDNIREGIKKRMAGLKNKYWQLLFERLDVVAKRLSTKTRKSFLEKLNGRSAIAFTSGNAYAVVLWAIKNANKYYDQQLIQLFRDLSTRDGVMNYKSNQRTWQTDGWRYMNDGRENPNTHYALDYRIVVKAYRAIELGFDGKSRGQLADNARDIIADAIAVMGNLGFTWDGNLPTHLRRWESNVSHTYYGSDDEPLFEVKAFKNGNLHLRFKPDAIRVLNVEAGRLLGWLRSPADVVAELGYSPEESQSCFKSNHQILPTNLKLLAAAG
jgi:hypothetical protein